MRRTILILSVLLFTACASTPTQTEKTPNSSPMGDLGKALGCVFGVCK